MTKYLWAIILGLSATTIANAEPIHEIDASNLCEMAARLSSRHPSTVDFSKVWDFDFSSKGNKALVVSTFTAKNSFGAELKFNIACNFDGQKITSVKVHEAFE